MREVFCQFYRPDEDELRRFVMTATVVPDANVLLGLYRLGSSERAQVLDVFEQIKDRLWLPYQAGYEYQRNRLSVVTRQAKDYEQARRIHGLKGLPEMEKWLGSLNVPDEVRERIQPLLPQLHASVNSAVKSYEDAIDALTDEHVVTPTQARSNDPVRARLDGLFTSNRIGARPDEKAREARIEEALRRASENIPPGYKDVDKSTDEGKAGDYLIWAEILDFAPTTEGPVLFVTMDQKDDWFERFAGEVQGPRSELVAEFAERSKHGYHQVTLAAFLDLANEFLSAQVPQTTIDRVGEPSEDDPSSLQEPHPEAMLRAFSELRVGAGRYADQQIGRFAEDDLLHLMVDARRKLDEAENRRRMANRAYRLARENAASASDEDLRLAEARWQEANRDYVDSMSEARHLQNLYRALSSLPGGDPVGTAGGHEPNRVAE